MTDIDIDRADWSARPAWQAQPEMRPKAALALLQRAGIYVLSVARRKQGGWEARVSYPCPKCRGCQARRVMVITDATKTQALLAALGCSVWVSPVRPLLRIDTRLFT